MAEWGTFSACVDRVIQRTGRLDLLDDAIDFVQQTIRETQVEALFPLDTVELRVENISADPYIMAMPNDFRQMKSVRYTDRYSARGEAVWPPHIDPGRYIETADFYWYNAGNQLVFTGMNTMIDLFYYRYLPTLPYFADDADKPAIYDDVTQMWTYDSNAGTNDEKEDKVTNWILFQFFNVIVNGGRSKIFNRVGDERRTEAYASYKQGQATMKKAQLRLDA